MSLKDTVASYLLSPNDRLTIQPPQRLFATATALANVAPGFAQPPIHLPLLGNKTVGFYFPWVGWSVDVIGATAITIQETFLLILDANGNEIVQLGTFNPTSLIALSEQANTIVIPKPVWTAGDLDAFSRIRNNVSIFDSGVQPLDLLSSVGAVSSAASNFSLNACAMVSEISGLTGNDAV